MDIRDLFKRKGDIVSWDTQVQKALEGGIGSKTAEDVKYNYMVVEQIFDGEKTAGELGSPINYELNIQNLAARSWQMYLTNDIARILIDTYVDWVVGDGLRFEYEPVFEILEDEGIKLNKKERSNLVSKVEKRFRLYTKTKDISYNKMLTFGEIQRQIVKVSKLSGDCLIILRYDDGITVELIDGMCLTTPTVEQMKGIVKRGNFIENGVEYTKSGEHVAYYIKEQNRADFGLITFNINTTVTRIPRKGDKSGRIQAILHYGDEYRIGQHRGMPCMSASIEKLSKIESMIEATVGGQQERVKVPWFFTQNHFSDGTDPVVVGMKQAYNAGKPADDLNVAADRAGNNVMLTTGKTVHILPIGYDVKALESNLGDQTMQFVDGLFIYLSASLKIPYEIALKRFVNSYSASRMSSQMWQITINILRNLFSSDVLNPIVYFFMYTQALEGKIQIKGFLNAIQSKDVILQQAYINSRFTSYNVPQADPSKEIKAKILELQNNLTTHEKIMDSQGNGDFESIIDALGEEYQKILATIPKEVLVLPNAEKDTAELPQEKKVKDPK
jgi:capsid protein